ncbi:hypothetical protein niasHT_024861 [Heterodera trifolii]|uniref:Potassium channel domain-containing protein n=1 Tax=Heterodera trifolii TaxID=157864 RepID=A0ABD2JG84_9BILA
MFKISLVKVEDDDDRMGYCNSSKGRPKRSWLPLPEQQHEIHKKFGSSPKKTTTKMAKHWSCPYKIWRDKFLREHNCRREELCKESRANCCSHSPQSQQLVTVTLCHEHRSQESPVCGVLSFRHSVSFPAVFQSWRTVGRIPLGWNRLIERTPTDQQILLLVEDDDDRMGYCNSSKGRPKRSWLPLPEQQHEIHKKFGSSVGENFKQKMWSRLCVVYCLSGIPLVFLPFSNLGELLAEFHWVGIASLKGQKENAGADDQLHPDGPCRLPLKVVVLLILFHSLLGGLIFHFWIQKMPIFPAIYFSFISITTIGFGDLCPEPQNLCETVEPVNCSNNYLCKSNTK